MKSGGHFSAPETASIVIATRNRREELRRALRSCLKQDVPVEILIIDDGSSDGTSEMVRTEFPTCRLEAREDSRGPTVRRNEAARMATGEVVFSIDDDAEFSAPDIVRIVLSEFNHPALAAVAIPLMDMNRGVEIRPRPPDGPGIWVTNEFTGTAYAFRRDVFNGLCGYRESLFRQGEEGDICLRLLAAGYWVRTGNSKPILHYESIKRSPELINLFGQRNLILFAWHNAPTAVLPFHLVITIWKGLSWGWKNRCLRSRIRGTWVGIKAALQERRHRDPVGIDTYRLFRRLKKKGPFPLEQLLRVR